MDLTWVEFEGFCPLVLEGLEESAEDVLGEDVEVGHFAETGLLGSRLWG